MKSINSPQYDVKIQTLDEIADAFARLTSLDNAILDFDKQLSEAKYGSDYHQRTAEIRNQRSSADDQVKAICHDYHKNLIIFPGSLKLLASCFSNMNLFPALIKKENGTLYPGARIYSYNETWGTKHLRPSVTRLMKEGVAGIVNAMLIASDNVNEYYGLPFVAVRKSQAGDSR